MSILVFRYSSGIVIDNNLFFTFNINKTSYFVDSPLDVIHSINKIIEKQVLDMLSELKILKNDALTHLMNKAFKYKIPFIGY